MTVEQIERELIVLPPEERLRLARWLLDTLTDLNSAKLSVNENPLLNIAGRFSGGFGRYSRASGRDFGARGKSSLWVGNSMSQLLDTGFLYALLNRSESRHEEVARASSLVQGTIYLPTVVTTEVAYLVQRDLGTQSLAEFIELLATESFRLIEPEPDDFLRAAQVVRQVCRQWYRLCGCCSCGDCRASQYHTYFDHKMQDTFDSLGRNIVRHSKFYHRITQFRRYGRWRTR